MEVIVTVVCNVAMLAIGVIIGADWKEQQEAN